MRAREARGGEGRSIGMKRAVFALVCACATPPRAVEIAAPQSSTTAAPAHDDVAIPREAARVTFDAEGPWAASFPADKSFAVHDLPDAQRVLLTWRVGKPHVVKRVESDEDYPANHVAPVDLVVQARGETRTITFGDVSGSIETSALSWCGRTGWKLENGEHWKPIAPALAVLFSIGLAQGDDEMSIVRDGRTLHVLHRVTSDGKCDDAKQGPLAVCDGEEWHRVADVRVPAEASIYEIVEREGKAFDCSMGPWGQKLVR
jgi:hypothetical protein